MPRPRADRSGDPSCASTKRGGATVGVRVTVMTDSIVLVDDHALLAQALISELRARGFHAQTIVPESQEKLASDLLVGSHPARLVILDINLGDAGSCLPLIRPLSERGVRVLVISGSTNAPEVGACLEAGACGFVSKASPFEHLLLAVDRSLRDQEVLTEGQRLEYLTALWEARGRQIEQARPFHRLTEREEEVLHLLCDGHDVRTIAQRYYMALPTVRTHVRGILTKLGVSSQLEAVTQAYRSGWHIMRTTEEAC